MSFNSFGEKQICTKEHTRRSKHAQKQARAEASMRAKADARAGTSPRDVALGAREDFTIFSPLGPPAVGTLPTVC